ncbi:transcriptional regulator ATRX homolog [Anthonomus grandis grandis]|uniref:transcriptional regulator ATRX homolog n=1 Tax=Anthonomus grandis grandis TaxID=2921223 RepID=UPI0021653243|nr:transcriptional regulator ATRX homolog [Anthonomus grandis grandis]
MKTKLIIVCGLMALVALSTAKPAQDEYEYEDEPAPPPKKAPARSLAGRRNPLAGKNNKATTTTTTTTAAPEEEAEGEPAEGDYVDEQVPETSSTTETSKKFIKSGIVRPFRSNDDLLATLKRRREQVVTNKQNKPVASSNEPKDDSEVEQPKKESKPASTGRRNRFSKPAKAASNEVPIEEPSSTARSGRARFSARS